MVAAIDVYNKPDFQYRAESFTILALNAWELLLKAKWLELHHNRLSSLFVRQGKGGKHPRYKRTRSGSPFTHSLDYLVKKLTEQKRIDEACRRNLEALTELRDTAVHFYHPSPKLVESVQEIGMAAVRNFATAVHDWFNEDLSRFNFYVMPLTFVQPPQLVKAIELNKSEENLLKYFQQLVQECDKPQSISAGSSPPYSVAVNIEVRFVGSKAVSGIPVRFTTDPNALTVQLTEEEFRDRYPWDNEELTNQCRKRYADFKVNKEYHKLRKSLETNPRFALERRLDPEKPRPKKMFYSTAILDELDRHYQKHKASQRTTTS